MIKTDEDPIQSIWRLQPILTVSITPEEMRKHAAQFESETIKRNRIDCISFVLVALMTGIGTLAAHGVLVRVGAMLMALWAVGGLYSVRRFHALAVQDSTESGVCSCAVWYRHNLERQRDVALSWSWGIALVVPGIVLILLGYVVNGTPWELSVILGGAGLFVFVAAIIHGRILAGRWQKEIDSLQSLRIDEQSHENER